MAKVVTKDKLSIIDYLSVANNILIFNQLAHILKILSAAEVPVILLKGAALGLTVYTEFGDRYMGDVDLLIREEDLFKARTALVNADYEIISEPEVPFNPFKSAFTGELQFTQDGLVIIDLHWKLISIEWLDRLIQIDHAALWEAATPIDVEGIPALQLSKIDMINHLCLHLVIHHFAHPTGYKDILQILQQDASFPWNAFVDRVAQFKMRTCCYFPLAAIALAREEVVPARVLQAIRPPEWQQKIVSLIANPQEGFQGNLSLSHARSYLLHLTMADHPIDLMKVMAWLFFPGPRWLAERYQIRSQLNSWFACLWHPIFVLWQGITGLRELLIVR
jgi:hypothetical protein